MTRRPGSRTIILRIVSVPAGEIAPPPLRLTEGRVTIGRHAANAWVLPDASTGVSREHAVIEGGQGGWQILDKSANGTFVNGQNVGIGNAWPLSPGDSIRIGGYEIVVEMDDGQDDPAVASESPPIGDPFDLGDLARAEERPPALPASDDLFGELGDNRTPLSPGDQTADPFNAPEQSGFGDPVPNAPPFGDPRVDEWHAPLAPAQSPQRSAFTDEPGSLRSLPDPFDQPPLAPDASRPGPRQTLPSDWDTPTTPNAPPVDLDPIEAALFGLAPKTGPSQAVDPVPGIDDDADVQSPPPANRPRPHASLQSPTAPPPQQYPPVAQMPSATDLAAPLSPPTDTEIRTAPVTADLYCRPPSPGCARQGSLVRLILPRRSPP